jgi:hypothetical protein
MEEGHIVDRQQFEALPAAQVAALVHERRPGLSVGFPLNGSRRWYALHRLAGTLPDAPESAGDPYTPYVETALQQQIRIHRMLYAHGVHTIVYPVFGGELLARGDAYNAAVLHALEHIALHPALRAFYDECDVQVRVYGDYARALPALGHAALLGRYARLMDETAAHRSCRLLYGLWAEDAADAAAQYSVDFFRRRGHAPSRGELVRSYYGTELGWLDAYIGFEKPTVFDVPLLLGPDTALYFTVAPSLGLSAQGLRAILYDLLYARAVDDPDTLLADPAQLRALGAYYGPRTDTIIGAGVVDPELGIWRGA